tara:strand:+ start:1310 stop:1771 length:462 start_codon:yes stop_codon:yes gene_type:complete
MPVRPILVVLILFTALLSGCVGNDPKRVHVRRTPERIARDDASPKSYGVLREELKAQDMANELSGDLKRSEAALKVSRYKINEITAVRGDPWDNYEDERRSTLYRHFSDRFAPPPVIAGEPLPGEAPPAADEGEGEEGGEEAPPVDDADDYGY